MALDIGYGRRMGGIVVKATLTGVDKPCENFSTVEPVEPILAAFEPKKKPRDKKRETDFLLTVTDSSG